MRHGQTEYNLNQIMQGRRINAALNATGREQAAALGDRFAKVRLDAVYASSLRRAIETAEAIVKRQSKALSVRCRSAFDEMCWGEYEGVPSGDRLEQMLRQIRGEWKAGNFGFTVKEGESILNVQQRAMEGLRDVVEHHRGQTVLIASHGRLLRVLLSSLLPEYGLSRMNDLGHHNTCVNEIIFDGHRYRAVTLNCVRHLSAYHNAA
ncbi:MAG: histidine phosphatase family protein [Bacteroidota bacterium]